MSDHFKQIYATQADAYDRMVAREDMHGNIFSALNNIVPLSGCTVVEFGAGTGRLTRLLTVLAAQIYAFDESLPMLQRALYSLSLTGMTNWYLGVADNRALPVASGCADVAIEGWSFGHMVGWAPHDWRAQVGRMITEMRRVLRKGGFAILLETMGTGNKQPQPPTAELGELYHWLESEHGFQYRWIRTDYQFASVDEADALTRFFFGDILADRIRAEGLTILPECTGVWWRAFD